MKVLKQLNYGKVLLVAFIIVAILYGFICSEDAWYIADLRYLYNRAYQMLSCFQDGNMPWFYYNDFGGVGYGSSFFYGQLTLVPFLIFIPIGFEPFINAYIITTIILHFVGSYCLFKRFCKQPYWVSVLYISCYFSYYNFLTSGTYSNLFAIGLSFFYIAFCIDFFRNKKSFIPAALIFYLIMNTHLITSIVTFGITLILLGYYWDKTRIKDCFKFFITTCVLCSYNVLNMLYHSGIINRTNEINARVIKDLKDSLPRSIDLYMDKIPFGGLLSSLVLKNVNGYHLFNWVFLGIIVFLIYKYKVLKNKKVFCLLVVSCLTLIISMRPIWLAINQKVLIPIQFPNRLTPYIICFIFIIAFKNLDRVKLYVLLFITCLPELFVGPFFMYEIPDEYKALVTDLDCQIVNGEYLDSSFIFDKDLFELYSSSVIDVDTGAHYAFQRNNNQIIVDDLDKSNITLQFPKLYYKGYTLTDNFGNRYEVRKGISQFCTVTIDNRTQRVVLQYQHPVWLKALWLLSFSGFIILCLSKKVRKILN